MSAKIPTRRQRVFSLVDIEPRVIAAVIAG